MIKKRCICCNQEFCCYTPKNLSTFKKKIDLNICRGRAYIPVRRYDAVTCSKPCSKSYLRSKPVLRQEMRIGAIRFK